MNSNIDIIKAKKYKKWIIALSILIPLVVSILFLIKIPIERSFLFLPPIYATTNGITAILLIWAVIAIKNGNRILHEKLIKICIGLSVLFLILYVFHHMTSEPTTYRGKGLLVPIYFFVLISHILLSIFVIPFVLITYVRGITNDITRHIKLAKYTFPLWLYVALTGVIVYLMIAPYYE